MPQSLIVAHSSKKNKTPAKVSDISNQFTLGVFTAMSSYDDIEKYQLIIKPIISKCAIHQFSSKNIHPHVFGNEEGII